MVTDKDREAAAQIYQRFRDHDYAKWIMDGTNANGDGDSVIQLMKAHREAAIAEREAQLVKWLRERGDCWTTDLELADAIEAGEPWK